jgi:hypothetical protein
MILAAAVQMLPQPDPYAPVPRAEAARLAYQAELGGDGEAKAIEAWLSQHPTAPVGERAMLAHRLCINLGVLVGGPRRLAACDLAARLTNDTEDKGDLAMARAFEHETPIAASGTARLPLTRSKVGHLMIDVAAGAEHSSWIVDTGAEITCLPASTAQALHVRMVEGTANIGTSTTIKVDGRMGMIDLLTIGSATVKHVPVLVLADDMLRLPDGSVIPGILGLPILAAFHQIAWLDHGAMLMLGRSVENGERAASAVPAKIYWHESGVGVPVSTAMGTRGLQLDSGANASQLGTVGLGLLTSAQQASIISADGRTGGAGGILTVKQRILPVLDYQLAGTPLHAEKMAVGSSASDKGAIGNDAILQLGSVTIDFEKMTILTAA